MSQPPKRLLSPDATGTTDPRPTKKRSRKRLVTTSSQADDVVRAVSVRVKTNTGRVSMRKLKGTTRDSQKSDQDNPGAIPAAADVTHLQGGCWQAPFVPFSLEIVDTL